MRALLFVAAAAMSLCDWRWIAGAPLPLPRAGVAAGTIDGMLVVAGGSYWSGGAKQRTARVDLYDSAARRWTRGTPLPYELSDAASVVLDGALYVLGGTDGVGVLNSVLCYSHGRWIARSDLGLPAARMRGAAAGEGRYLYYSGGLSQLDDYRSASAQVWRIDLREPDAGWTALPDLPSGPRFLHAAEAREGELHVLGGARTESGSVRSLADVWTLDVAARRWRPRSSLPSPLRAAWSGWEHGTVLLFGGYSTEFSAKIYGFDPGSGSTWVEGSLPEPVADAPFSPTEAGWIGTGGETGVQVRGGRTWLGAARHATHPPREGER